MEAWECQQMKIKRYMKYLYPYECEKRGLSSPGELQVAIDSNRREGRRQSYGSAIFNYSPVGTPTNLSSTKMSMSHLAMSTYNGVHLTQGHNIKKEDGLMSGGLPGRVGEMSLGGHHGAAAALEQLISRRPSTITSTASGEPPDIYKDFDGSIIRGSSIIMRCHL
ncbi:AT-rich interactive domain-containing protein 3A-like [Oncorhynchus keta]|uniref:AT-rich interactive domain-containing protein 3A-like n=1 Tax=Oncorhynchus keta TaxID=8018 RepID=UPI00227CB602|nr:AT-rich interactive domain-containing protein 3A-like [Oncorhynchus keta]